MFMKYSSCPFHNFSHVFSLNIISRHYIFLSCNISHCITFHSNIPNKTCTFQTVTFSKLHWWLYEVWTWHSLLLLFFEKLVNVFLNSLDLTLVLDIFMLYFQYFYGRKICSIRRNNCILLFNFLPCTTNWNIHVFMYDDFLESVRIQNSYRCIHLVSI